MSKPAFHLSAIERDSSAWQRIQTHLTAKLEALRARVENPTVPEADRLGLCWRIYELKELLKLGTQPAEPRQDAGE